MKTLSKFLLVLCLGAVIYFATIGRSELYELMDMVSAAIQAIAQNYTKK